MKRFGSLFQSGNIMSGNRESILFIFLHHRGITNNVGKKNGSELAVLLVHVLCKIESKST